MPSVICTECGRTIPLDPFAYWNAEGVDVRCRRCGALLNITLRSGELKEINKKEGAKPKEEWQW